MTAPFPDLIDESLREASFLWGRWEDDLTSPTRSLDEVNSWTEDRLHGALDGVRVAGAQLGDIAKAGLTSDHLRDVSVSAALLGSSNDEAVTALISEELRTADGARLDAILRALELTGTPPALRAAARILLEREPRYSGGLCRLKAFRRVGGHDEITRAFRSGDRAAQVFALRAAAYATTHGSDCIREGLDHQDPVVRAAAVEVAIASGMRQAWERGRALAAQLDAPAAPYLKLIALLGSTDDHEIVYSALRVESLRVPAIWALGHLGTIRAVEACISGMAHEPLARACGEAYCWITGAELTRDRLSLVEPTSEVPSFESDNLDANLVPSPESLWPLPDRDAVAQHWASLRETMAPDVRHIHGRPAGHDTLLAMVERGPMLRRPDLILELKARSRGRYDVEPRAFVARQRDMMAAARRTLLTEAV